MILERTCWRLNKSNVNTFSLEFQKILVGKLQEIVNFIYFSIVKEKRKLLLISLIGNNFLAWIKGGHSYRNTPDICKSIKNNFGSIAFTTDILGQSLWWNSCPRVLPNLDPLIKFLEKLISLIPETVELKIIILGNLLFFWWSTLGHLFFKAIGITLNVNSTNLHENMLTFWSHRYQIVFDHIANWKLQFI